MFALRRWRKARVRDAPWSSSGSWSALPVRRSHRAGIPNQCPLSAWLSRRAPPPATGQPTHADPLGGVEGDAVTLREGCRAEPPNLAEDNGSPVDVLIERPERVEVVEAVLVGIDEPTDPSPVRDQCRVDTKLTRWARRGPLPSNEQPGG